MKYSSAALELWEAPKKRQFLNLVDETLGFPYLSSDLFRTFYHPYYWKNGRGISRFYTSIIKTNILVKTPKNFQSWCLPPFIDFQKSKHNDITIMSFAIF